MVSSGNMQMGDSDSTGIEYSGPDPSKARAGKSFFLTQETKARSSSLRCH